MAYFGNLISNVGNVGHMNFDNIENARRILIRTRLELLINWHEMIPTSSKLYV